jgi:hypothetical protein
VTRDIALLARAPASSSESYRSVPVEEIIVRHAVVTIQLMKQARNAAVAQAEADERRERQRRVVPRAEPAAPGRLGHVVTLVRRAASRAHGPAERAAGASARSSTDTHWTDPARLVIIMRKR